jgi:hypothetical protein
MTATISLDRTIATQVDFLRVGTDVAATESLVRELQHGEDELAAQVGFVASSLHVSTEGAIVVWRQWADDASRRAGQLAGSQPAARARVERLGDHDRATYEAAFVHTSDGSPFSIDSSSGLATLIDLEVTDPTRQGAILEFNTTNSQAFTTQPGLHATAVLRGAEGTRIATYSQWQTVADWIAAVKTTAGGRIPALDAVQTVHDVNTVLQQVSREMGALPEYHAYDVVSVIGRR